MSDLVTQDYRNAPSGIGPMAEEWSDKPHRLVYDLCAEVDNTRVRLTTLRTTLAERDTTIAGLRAALKMIRARLVWAKDREPMDGVTAMERVAISVHHIAHEALEAKP